MSRAARRDPALALADAGPKVRRLFDDPVAEDARYFKKYGYFPVMHLLVVRRDVAEKTPQLAPALIDMWEQSKRVAVSGSDAPSCSY